MKRYERVIIISAILFGCVGIGLVVAMALGAGSGRPEATLPPYQAPTA